MRSMKAAVAALAALMVAPALAAEHAEMKGNAEAGKQIAAQGLEDNPLVMACQSCHGMDGSGNPTANFPRLAGQNTEYFVKQLEDFASGDRANYPTMKNIAGGLSEQQMWDVAAYYGSKKISVEGADASQAVMKLGERIAKQGLAEKDVPACTSCHGPEGRGVPPVFPQVGGQHASYITKQLNDWQSGDRANDPAQMMKDIAPKLSDEQKKAVGAWFSNRDL